MILFQAKPCVGFCNLIKEKNNVLFASMFFNSEREHLVYKYNPHSNTWIGLANDADHRFWSWYEAQHFCISTGGHLLTLESQSSGT